MATVNIKKMKRQKRLELLKSDEDYLIGSSGVELMLAARLSEYDNTRRRL